MHDNYQLMIKNLGLVIIILICFSALIEGAEISERLSQTTDILADNERVRVIVRLKEESGLETKVARVRSSNDRSPIWKRTEKLDVIRKANKRVQTRVLSSIVDEEFNLKHKTQIVNSLVGYATKKGIEDLADNDLVEYDLR